jgi:hypothetical protein
VERSGSATAGEGRSMEWEGASSTSRTEDGWQSTRAGAATTGEGRTASYAGSSSGTRTEEGWQAANSRTAATGQGRSVQRDATSAGTRNETGGWNIERSGSSATAGGQGRAWDRSGAVPGSGASMASKSAEAKPFDPQAVMAQAQRQLRTSFAEQEASLGGVGGGQARAGGTDGRLGGNQQRPQNVRGSFSGGSRDATRGGRGR